MTPHSAGWYRDPSSHLGHRFWDGDQWFQYAADGSLRPVRQGPLRTAA